MKLTKERKIGIIAFISLALFIWLASFLKGNNLLTVERVYYVVYPDANGLVSSSPVMLNGMKVGRVSKVSFVSPTDNRIVAKINVAKKFFIPSNTIASMEMSSLLGGKSIVLLLGDSETPLNEKEYMIGQQVPDLEEQLNPLKSKAFALVSTIDSVIGSLNTILNKNTITNLNQSFESLSAVLNNLEVMTNQTNQLLANEKKHLSLIIQNVESISSNLKNNNTQISTILDNFASISDSIAKANVAQTITNLNATLKNVSFVMESVQKGEGSVGKLIYDDQLYLDLRKSVQALNLLLEDVKLHPSKYVQVSVFGKKNK